MSMAGPRGDWHLKSASIKGFLLDITGVLHETSNDGLRAIPGSVEAVEKLRASGIKVRFCTNETQCTKEAIEKKLKSVGFSARTDEIFSPAPAARSVIQERGLRPHLLVHEDVLPEFAGIDQSNPDCVVVGDAAEFFTYENVNNAFQLLMHMEKPVLIALGKGKFYQSHGQLMMDVGAYTKALEYACGLEAEVVGKPSVAFFTAALHDMGLQPDEAVMVGDDIIGDVGGAQSAGIKGIQVRTGKFRPGDENHPRVKPDGYVDNLAQAVEIFLDNRH